MFLEANQKKTTFPIPTVEQIPIGEGRTFQIGKLSLAIFRTRTGDLFATQATCPHKGGLLADGIVGAGKVVCPLHSYKFDLATGQPVGNDCPSLKTYPVTVSEKGEILISILDDRD
jgi:nitrite reductase (NADH) small subunit